MNILYIHIIYKPAVKKESLKVYEIYIYMYIYRSKRGEKVGANI
jgi:hypothetical protein